MPTACACSPRVNPVLLSPEVVLAAALANWRPSKAIRNGARPNCPQCWHWALESLVVPKHGFGRRVDMAPTDWELLIDIL